MTDEELLAEIKLTYERAERNSHGRSFLNYDMKITSVVFYRVALHELENRPFKDEKFHDMVTGFVEMKLDAAFKALTPEEYELVFILSEELQEWEKRYIPSAKKAQ